MGWTNYLVLKREKIAFELDREASYYSIEDALESARKLESIIDVMVESDMVKQTKLSDLSVDDVAKVLKVFSESSSFDYNTMNKLFIAWFFNNGYGEELEIMFDETFDEVRSEYKVIERKYEL